MKKSSVFHVNDSSVKNIHAVYDFIQTVTDKILFGTVSVIYVSFKMKIYCVIHCGYLNIE